MPWASTVRPNLGIGLLQASAKKEGFWCKSTYPNLLLSSMIGSELYEYFADTPGVFPIVEHCFAVDIFGKDVLESDAYFTLLIQSAGVSTEKIKPFFHIRDVIVPKFIQKCIEMLLQYRADILGFSCTFNQTLASLAIARRLKHADPKTVILFGGACVHGSMGEAYARAFPEYIDHVFTGEADASFVRLLKAYSNGSELNNISGVTANGCLAQQAEICYELNSLPIPEYTDYFDERKILLDSKHNMADCLNLPFESARGCWWGQKSHCTFCGLNNEGMLFRRKSSVRVARELLTLAKRHKMTSFMASDNILDYRAYKELLPTLSNLPLDLNLFYEIKANLRRDDVSLLAKAGVQWVQPGIESFSDHVLRLMRKGITALQNIQTLKWLAEFRIHPSYNLLVGFPGECESDYEFMLQLFPMLKHLPAPSGRATLVQAHRFSPLFNEPAKYGLRELKAEKYYKHLIPSGILRGDEFGYFFEREVPRGHPVWHYQDKINAAIDEWRDCVCNMSVSLGAGSICVYKQIGERKEKLVLTEEKALAFVLGDSVITVKRLEEILQAFCGQTISAAKKTVNDLVTSGLAVIDNNRLVTVIPFVRPHTSNDLAKWVKRWFAIEDPARVAAATTF